MYKYLVIALVLNLSLQTGFICHQMIQDKLYKLSPLMREQDYIFPITYMEQQYELHFNFCKKINTPCDNQRSFAALFLKSNQTQCLKFSQNKINNLLSEQILFISYKFSLIDKFNPNIGIQVAYPHGDPFHNNNTDSSVNDSQQPLQNQIQYNLTMNIFCNEGIQGLKQDDISYMNNAFQINVESKFGCPVLSVSKLNDFLISHSTLLAVNFQSSNLIKFKSKFIGNKPLIQLQLILIGMGIMSCFYGLQLLVPLLFVISGFAGFVLSLLFLNEVLISPDSGNFFFWLVVLLSVFLGGAFGYAAMILPKYGFFVLGAVFGITCGFILDELIFQKYESGKVFYIIVSVLLAGGFGFLSFVMWRKMVIIMSSCTGSYMIVRGFSLVFGHWPSNIDLALKIRNKETVFDDDGDAFIIYFVIMAILAYYGLKHQREQDLKFQESEQLKEKLIENGQFEMNNLDEMSDKPRENGQFDEVIQNIKNNEIYQKINNHELINKVKEAGKKILDQTQKAVQKGKDNLKKEEEKREKEGISLI